MATAASASGDTRPTTIVSTTPMNVMPSWLNARGMESRIMPETNPATKTFQGAGRFQLRSVGRDGKPGTSDDIRAGN